MTYVSHLSQYEANKWTEIMSNGMNALKTIDEIPYY